jgi:hypothetical protein
MRTGKLRWLPLAFCLLCVIAHGQEAKLVPGQPDERALAGGESHTYQLTLAAGQFLRVIVQQKGIDVVVQLMTPDGKPLGEADFTGTSGQESLSREVAIGGDYRVVIRSVTATAVKGAYEAKVEVKAAP